MRIQSVFSMPRRFLVVRLKGCEADVVILLDVDLNDKRWKEPLAMYTALSRAKVQVYVLTK
jgi:superfamily I DNA and RNA helicase